MTLLTVGEGKEYSTISAALAAAKDDDYIDVWPGVYRECLVIDKSITLRGLDGSVLDGGYGPHLFSDPKYFTWCNTPVPTGKIGKPGRRQLPAPTMKNKQIGNWPGDWDRHGRWSALIRVTAPQVRIANMVIINAPGNAVMVNAPDFSMVSCRVDFAYNALFVAQSLDDTMLDGVYIISNTFTRGGMCLFDASRMTSCPAQKWGETTQGGPENVPTAVHFKRTRNSVAMDNTVAWCGGEGLGVGTTNVGVTIASNELFNNHHVQLYGAGGDKVALRNNRVFWTQAANAEMTTFDSRTSKYIIPDGIVVGDELASGTNPNIKILVENNVVVGLKKAWSVRTGDAYATRMDDSAIRGNTFVRNTPQGTAPIIGFDTDKGAGGKLLPHQNVVFEGNLIADCVGSPVIGAANVALGPGVKVGYNCWPTTGTIAASLKSATDVKGVYSDTLVNPAAVIEDTTSVYDTGILELRHNYNDDNYRLVSAASPAWANWDEASPSPTWWVHQMSEDATGVERDAPFDIGAFEYSFPEPEPSLELAWSAVGPVITFTATHGEEQKKLEIAAAPDGITAQITEAAERMQAVGLALTDASINLQAAKQALKDLEAGVKFSEK